MSRVKKSIDGMVRGDFGVQGVPEGITPRRSSQLGGQRAAGRGVSRAAIVEKTGRGGTRRNNAGVANRRATSEESVKNTRANRRAKRETEDFLEPVGTLEFGDAGAKKEPVSLPKTKKELKKPKKKWSKKKKIGVGLLAVLVLGVAVFLIWGDAIIAKLTGGNSRIWDAMSALIDDGQPLREDANGRSNVLVFGTSGYDMTGSGHDGAQLTDSIMVISIDQDTGDAALISLPRDLKVSGACMAGKINEVYWCNNQDGTQEQAGAEALMRQVGEVTGLDLQYYVHVNWGALVQIVDSVGGVTVTLDESINDPWTNTYIQAGETVTLNGEQALGLARARHGTEGGDFTRGNSQQEIMIALVDTVMRQGLGLTEAFNLINILGDNMRMNFATNEIKTIVRLGEKVDLNNLRQIPLLDETQNIRYLTTAMIDGISYVVPSAGTNNYDDLQAYIKMMLSSDPAVREGAQIMVLNGSGQAGVAGTEARNLKNDGFMVGLTDDAPTADYQGYTVYVLNESKTGTREALEQKYNVTAQPASALPAGIYTEGYDFVVIVGV